MDKKLFLKALEKYCIYIEESKNFVWRLLACVKKSIFSGSNLQFKYPTRKLNIFFLFDGLDNKSVKYQNFMEH